MAKKTPAKRGTNAKKGATELSTMSQSDFARLLGVSRQMVGKMKAAGEIVMNGSNVEVTASLQKLLSIKQEKSPLDDELKRQRIIRLEQQNGEHDRELIERIQAEVSREMSNRLRELRSAIAKYTRGNAELTAAFQAAIDGVRVP